MGSSGDYDLVQDITTDCSVVASLCASMDHLKPGPSSLLPALMFPIDPDNGQPQISASGKYVFRMYFNGCFRKVVVDDRLPTSRNDRTLYVVDRQNPDLIWPALIEKAYLKVRGGYDFPGSNSGTDLWMLTGWIPQQIFLQSDEVDCDQTWRRVKKAYDYGDVVVTLGTGRLSPDEEEVLGLAGEHDYAVLDISEESGNRRLLVKNPWCDGLVWKGVGALEEASPSRSSPSDDDDRQRQRQPAKLKPGTFWIGFDDVAQNFESLYLNWNPSLFTERQDHHFTWQRPEPNLAHSFAHNPQYAMTASADGSAWILLSRHFQDAELDIARGRNADSHDPDSPGGSGSGSGGGGGGATTTLSSVSNKLGFMSLYIFETGRDGDEGDGERALLPDKNVVYRGPFVDSPQTLAPFEARRGARYTVAVASQDLPLPRYALTLSFFSRCPLAVRPARDGLAHRAEADSAWTRRTAGGNAASPTYGSNPQFRLRISPSPSQPLSEPGPVTLLLSTARDDLPVHVDVVWAGGGRVSAPISQRDLLASSGDYRRGSAVARAPRIDPGVYTVVCSTFDPGQLAGFALRVASALPCALEPVPASAAGRLRLRLPGLVFADAAAVSPESAFAATAAVDGNTTTTTTTTVRLVKRAAIRASRLTRASVVVTGRPREPQTSHPGSPSSSPLHQHPQHQHQHQHQQLRRHDPRTAVVRLRLVYGSGPDKTVIATTTGGAGSSSSSSSSAAEEDTGGFREVGVGGLRTPEFDIEPRRGLLWLVAEQIGGVPTTTTTTATTAGSSSQPQQQQQKAEDAGLQVEILCDAHLHVGDWEVVDA